MLYFVSLPSLRRSKIRLAFPWNRSSDFGSTSVTLCFQAKHTLEPVMQAALEGFQLSVAFQQLCADKLHLHFEIIHEVLAADNKLIMRPDSCVLTSTLSI